LLSTFRGNSAGAAIYNAGVESYLKTVTITDSTFSGNTASNDGGAIFNDSGTVTTTGSWIRRNSASLGGGIYSHGGTLTINDSTIRHNSGGDLVVVP
jgi:predicted outer membrane repeat protein